MYFVKIGLLVRSALTHYKKKVDMLNSSISNNFESWGIDSGHANVVHYFWLHNRDVVLQSNQNLHGAQKEVMFWHLKLDISISQVQPLMRVSEMHEPNGKRHHRESSDCPKT